MEFTSLLIKEFSYVMQIMQIYNKHKISKVFLKIRTISKKKIYIVPVGRGGGLAVEIYMRENPCKPTRKMRTLSKNSN